MSMTTELAQREKFEAWTEECCALPWGYLKKRRTYSGHYSEQIYTSLWGEWKAACGGMVEALEAAEKRIAELEARTVKLPEALMPAQHNSGELFMTPDNVEHGGYLNRDGVLRALRNAGVAVECE